MTLLLEFTTDAASAEVLRRFLVAHVVAGLDRVSGDGTRLTRAVDVDDVTYEVEILFSTDGAIRVDTTAPDSAHHVLRIAVSRWLDAPGPTAVELAHLSAEPMLTASVARHPGLRIPGAISGFETACFSVLGQQVSLVAARTFAARLVAFAGTDRGDRLWSSPSPARIAESEPEEFRAALGITRARARTIQALATAVTEGLDLRPGVDLPSTRKALLALPGIGTWTTEYIALRCLGDRNAFLGGDLVLRRQLGVPTEKEALAIAERWRPSRGLAVLHLWTDAVFS